MIDIRNIDAEETKALLAGINRILPQQSPGKKSRAITERDVEEALSNPNFHLVLVTDTEREGADRVIGMGTVFLRRNVARWIAEIHDVVMDETYRGQGLGERLTKHLVAIVQSAASEKQTSIKLYLTSRPSRVAANALYQKLGFTLVAEAQGEWGTNLYKMMVRPENLSQK